MNERPTLRRLHRALERNTSHIAATAIGGPSHHDDPNEI
jgi:hypothetical protein